VGIASAIAKLAYLGLVIAGIVSGELRTTRLAIFLAVGALAWFGLPYLPRGADFVTPALAIIDIALVFAIYKGDVRIM
jgi:hypothetical protein